MRQMLLTLGTYIKIAIDIQREILVGGGELHADCERVLIKSGSQQSQIWGVDWYPAKQTIGYESIINLRSTIYALTSMIAGGEFTAVSSLMAT